MSDLVETVTLEDFNSVNVLIAPFVQHNPRADVSYSFSEIRYVKDDNDKIFILEAPKMVVTCISADQTDILIVFKLVEKDMPFLRVINKLYQKCLYFTQEEILETLPSEVIVARFTATSTSEEYSYISNHLWYPFKFTTENGILFPVKVHRDIAFDLPKVGDYVTPIITINGILNAEIRSIMMAVTDF